MKATKKKKKTDITEGNRLIAEFMGDSVIVEDDGIAIISQTSFLLWFSGVNRLEEHRKKCYHSSWDWLMPVVEKIELIDLSNGQYGYTVHIEGWRCKVTDAFGDKKSNKIRTHIAIENNPVRGLDISSKIEAVYIAVVEFIKWHNNQNK